MSANFGKAVSDEAAYATIRHAIQSGANFVDTAPLYGNGLAEARIGEALRDVPRSSYVLGSKVGWIPDPAKPGGNHALDGERNYSGDAIKRSVEASLKRLHTDYLDYALVHDPELTDTTAVILDEAFPTLNDLKRQGVVRAVGAGLNVVDYMIEFANHADVDCFLLAGRYTLLEQLPMHIAFPLMQQKRISVFLGGVYNSGILATGAVPGARYQYAIAPEPILRLTRVIEGVCARHGVSLRVAAAQFAAAHPAVTTLVLGMVKPSEVDENLAALNAKLPTAFWDELKERGLIEADAPTPQ
jgi:D-threo-aldose 1-dehydrogenase